MKMFKKSRVETSRFIIICQSSSLAWNKTFKVVSYGKFYVLSESVMLFSCFEKNAWVIEIKRKKTLKSHGGMCQKFIVERTAEVLKTTKTQRDNISQKFNFLIIIVHL